LLILLLWFLLLLLLLVLLLLLLLRLCHCEGEQRTSRGCLLRSSFTLKPNVHIRLITCTVGTAGQPAKRRYALPCGDLFELLQLSALISCSGALKELNLDGGP
jgi:hypothetical protein